MRDIDPMLDYCWPTVYDNGSSLNRLWVILTSQRIQGLIQLTRYIKFILNVGFMLGQRRRRRPDIKPTVGQRLEFVGLLPCGRVNT